MNKIIICTYDENLVPTKKTPGAVCRDLKIAKNFTIEPNGYKQVSCGIKTHMPIGWCSKVYARSGLPAKMGLTLANAIAIFDADYRGEYIMQFLNITDQSKYFEAHTRMTQIEFCPYYIGSQQYGTKEIPELQIIVDTKIYENFETTYPSERGTGRFNSTGTK